MPSLRIASFNLENLDDRPGEQPSLSERIAVVRPQLVRLRADVLCLQEVNGQESEGAPRGLAALDARYIGREDKVEANEWATYQADRTRLKEELQAMLAAQGQAR